MKKIFAFITAAFLLLSSFAVPVYADDGDILDFNISWEVWKSDDFSDKRDEYLRHAVESSGGVYNDGASLSYNLGDRLIYDLYVDLMNPLNDDYSIGSKAASQALGIGDYNISLEADWNLDLGALIGKIYSKESNLVKNPTIRGKRRVESDEHGDVSSSAFTIYKFDDGCYLTMEYVRTGVQELNFYWNMQTFPVYNLVFKLYDSSGGLTSSGTYTHGFYYHNWYPQLPLYSPGGSPVQNFKLYADEYYFTFLRYGADGEPYKLFEVSASCNNMYSACPYLYEVISMHAGNGGESFEFSDEEDIPLIPDGDGKFISPDGRSFTINPDGTVTDEDGNTYQFDVDFWDDIYNEFKFILEQEINNYEENNSTDLSGVLAWLKKIYSKLSDIFEALYNNILEVLKDIRDYLKQIAQDVSDLTEQQQEDEKTNWLNAIQKLKNKIGYDQLLDNINIIKSDIFGERTATYSNEGRAAVSYVNSDGVSVVAEIAPHIHFTFMGRTYDLFESIGSIPADTMNVVKEIISAFLWIGFFLSLFRSAPSILGGVGALMPSIIAYSESKMSANDVSDKPFDGGFDI